MNILRYVGLGLIAGGTTLTTLAIGDSLKSDEYKKEGRITESKTFQQRAYYKIYGALGLLIGAGAVASRNISRTPRILPREPEQTQ